MKYWFYSEGNILGPYAPAELLSLPAFGQGSLVCPETSAGDNPGDWKAAEGVAEIAEALSVGVGGVVSARAGGISGLYELETGLSSTIGASYYETRNDQPYGYENLLNTIDNILGAYKESEAPAAGKPVPDYGLIDRFDIRLSRIQEELEAARWEKNLLLEKIRAKEGEERKNRERIAELEGKLKGALDQTEFQEKELSQVQHLAELAARTETLKKIDELRKEDFVDRSRAPSSPAARPVGESRILKSIHPSQEILLERTFAAGPASPRCEAHVDDSADKKEEKDNGAITSRKLRSLGHSPAPVIPVSGEEHKVKASVPLNDSFAGPRPLEAPGERAGAKEDVSGSGSFSSPVCAAPEEVSQPLPRPFGRGTDNPEAGPEFKGGTAEPEERSLSRQASGAVYDFTVMAGQTAENGKGQFKIEPKNEPAPQVPQPAPQPVSRQPASQAQEPVPPQNAWQPQPAFQAQEPVPPQNAWQPQPAPQVQEPVPPQNAWQAVAPKEAAVPDKSSSFGREAEVDGTALTQIGGSHAPKGQDKTERLIVSPRKQKEDAKKNVQPARKGRGKMAFISTLIIFGAMAAGGLGYFFLGEGGSFSEFSMLNFGGNGKSQKASFSTQVEPKAGTGRTEAALAEDIQAPAPDQVNQVMAPPASSAPVKPAFEAASNENTGRALETVKNYKLSGGRGTVAGWFANSFLSNSASGSNEEWSATILHGDIFVVQYRLLRPRQDPLIYQFEVDVARNLIVRGINNNAIELLDFSSKVTVRAEPAPKLRARKAAPKAGKSRGISILPLPDEPSARPAQEDPTGFETVAPEDNEKVKYIMAQESDEELF